MGMLIVPHSELCFQWGCPADSPGHQSHCLLCTSFLLEYENGAPGGYDLVGLMVMISESMHRMLTTQHLPVPDSQMSKGSLTAGSALDTHGLSSLALLAGGRTGLNHPTGFQS